mgnify:CR=1 FL=1
MIEEATVEEIAAKLAIMAFEGKSVTSDWQRELLKKFLNDNIQGVEEFLRSFIQDKKKLIEKRLPYLDIAIASRNTSCDCCQSKITRLQTIIRVSGEKFCPLCGYLLVTTNSTLFSTFVEKIKALKPNLPESKQ